MITKDDCMSILVRLEKEKEININQPMLKLAMSKEVPIEVLKFIASNQGIEVVNFYEMLRKNHNQKKSPLYTNILKEQEAEEAIITLTCLLTQIVLYSKKLESNKERFLREARAEEITRVLNNYFKTQEIASCINLLKLIKSDVIVLDYINGRRDLN